MKHEATKPNQIWKGEGENTVPWEPCVQNCRVGEVGLTVNYLISEWITLRLGVG